jgi:hypothetical protein
MDLTRLVTTQYDEKGNAYWETFTSLAKNLTRAECRVPPEKVIPVIFVPGIMGSNLKLKENIPPLKKGEAAWAPPNGAVEGIAAVNKWRVLKPAARQRILNPENTEVDSNGAFEVSTTEMRQARHEYGAKLTAARMSPSDEANKQYEGAKKRVEAVSTRYGNRGWGSVHAESYGEILSFLDERLNDVLDPDTVCTALPAPRAHWEKLQEPKPEWGAAQPLPVLTTDELRKMAGYRFPVHAVAFSLAVANFS